METTYKGLTHAEAESALSRFGKNEISDVNKITPLGILFRQVKKNFVIYLLAFTAIISFLVGKDITAYTILAVITLVVVVGFIQEYRAEAAVSALKRMVNQMSVVIRNGKKEEILSSLIVPGDIVILSSGDKVPADAEILASNELRVDESVLTGESVEVSKKSGEDKVFMGTFVVNGRAYVRVGETGMNTRFGKIAGMISDTEKSVPLQDKVNRISKYMVGVAITMSLLTGGLMFFRAESLNPETIVNIVILVIAMSVAAFPEGFPVVLITTLATGASRMAKQNAIVNRMSIIETLGETTIICTDKTGTITKGEMTVRDIYLPGRNIKVTGEGYSTNGSFVDGEFSLRPERGDDLYQLLTASVMCNDASIERTGQAATYRVKGTPTEAALLIMGAKGDIFYNQKLYNRIDEKPFSSERKMMSILAESDKSRNVYAKGAPEVILSRVSHVLKNGKIIKITPKIKRDIIRENKKMTAVSLRTLAVAYKPMSKRKSAYTENSLVFIGLVGMEDPPRPEAKAAIQAARDAGIKVKMITGDNKDTARVIAGEVGLVGKIMTGRELDEVGDKELGDVIEDIAVFARVRPEHKLRIVNLLKKRGEIVTMTGDGVNDAPALKGAHIGVAMGKNGTDVSRSVADLTLKDDNFATIIYAVKEGRTIFNNIKKFVSYQLSCNLAELMILFVGVLLAPLFGWSVPLLLALHILFMNLVTDNLPAITLGLNRSSNDIMSDKPRKSGNILTRPMFFVMVFNGILMGLVTLIVYYVSYNVTGESVETSRTIALVTLIMLEIASAFNFRSFRYGVLTRSLFVNPYLLWASLISFAATLAILYTPLRNTFETTPLALAEWVVAVMAAVFILVVYDLLKFYSTKTGTLLSYVR